MLVSRHGVTDGQPHAHDLPRERLITRWIPVVDCLCWAVRSSPTAGFKTTFRNLAVCTEGYREVAS